MLQFTTNQSIGSMAYKLTLPGLDQKPLELLK